jgi:hypothetical protein
MVGTSPGCRAGPLHMTAAPREETRRVKESHLSMRTVAVQTRKKTVSWEGVEVVRVLAIEPDRNMQHKWEVEPKRRAKGHVFSSGGSESRIVDVDADDQLDADRHDASPASARGGCFAYRGSTYAAGLLIGERPR